ncbi:MAG: hypothetical protein K8I30_16595 [Anaerolineae bacterium]|nr:hypothetical protein [Anaerolineae bacterium]
MKRATKRMDNSVLALNAEIKRLSSALLATADESWSEIQRQTVKIILEATDRMMNVNGLTPNGDREHWLHDLRSPGASMLSAVTLLLDEADYAPSSLDTDAVKMLQQKIVELRAAIDLMTGEHEEW